MLVRSFFIPYDGYLITTFKHQLPRYFLPGTGNAHADLASGGEGGGGGGDLNPGRFGDTSSRPVNHCISNVPDY